MSFEDFSTYYDKLEICHLGPDSAKTEADDKCNWEGRTEKGAWIRGSSAGGCRNFLNTFASNPQFRYTFFSIKWNFDKVFLLPFSLTNFQVYLISWK